jgi:hypothetical protein
VENPSQKSEILTSNASWHLSQQSEPIFPVDPLERKLRYLGKRETLQSMHLSGSMSDLFDAFKFCFIVFGRMQAAGQTSTQPVSLVPMTNAEPSNNIGQGNSPYNQTSISPGTGLPLSLVVQFRVPAGETSSAYVL